MTDPALSSDTETADALRLEHVEIGYRVRN